MTDDTRAKWREIAEQSRQRAVEATDRKHRAYLACGTPRRDVSEPIERAYAIARQLRLEDGANFRLMCVPPKRDPVPAASLRSRDTVIPGDHVGVHADQLLAMEHELADALAAMHSARAELAMWMAGDYPELTVAELERVRENLANVAAGKAWDGTPQ